MIKRLDGAAVRYAWGTDDAIPKLLGVPADGRPFAEYWLGAHPAAPALAEGTGLDRLLAQHPEWLGADSAERFGARLPFLVKLLSARQALSIQVHPSRAQAEAGFARENAAGIPLDAPERTYRDDWPKPEILVALDRFETLSGLREGAATAELLAGLGQAAAFLREPLAALDGAAATRKAVELALAASPGQVAAVVAACAQASDDEGPVGALARLGIGLHGQFPGDPGVLVALLMNHLVLEPGQAAFVPAGLLHAHLRGTGVEVMANSDNVVRGGLTPKHIDQAELFAVTDFAPTTPQPLRPAGSADPAVRHFRLGPGGPDGDGPLCPEFALSQVTPGQAPVPLPGTGPRIVLALPGDVTLRQATGPDLPLSNGQAAFIPAGRKVWAAPAAPAGTAWVASPGQAVD